MSMGGGIRHRESFDEVAELYDQARPGYPKQLVDDLVKLSGLYKGHRVLEIGSGTGQLTVPLAEHGAILVAVELGANLAYIVRRKLGRFKQAEVVVADFEEWTPPAVSFDLVVAATAFHWLDPTTRVRKCANAWRPSARLTNGWM